jgi:hypothetical protein
LPRHLSFLERLKASKDPLCRQAAVMLAERDAKIETLSALLYRTSEAVKVAIGALQNVSMGLKDPR